ncbi:hypothetical protein [Undibacterium sp.]|uniref:hypothetical protein n=1 Tax=Undibacterium sp. TaxID=1914977 RepID=UPI00374CC1E4
MNDKAKRDEEAEIIFEMGIAFIQHMIDTASGWEKAYFRIQIDENHSSSTGIYIVGSEVEFIELPYSFAHGMEKKATRLAEVFGKDEMVMLLFVKSNYGAEAFFDYEDMDKWEISKLDGRTGIPEGF